MKLGFILSG